MAKRCWKYSVVANDSITLPEFYSKRFHDRKNIVSTVFIIMVFFACTWAVFRHVRKLFATLFGLDYATMMLTAPSSFFCTRWSAATFR